MIKFGLVTAYDGKTGMAALQYARPDACEKCGACGGASGRRETLRLKAECAPGNWVKVELPDGRFLSAAAIAYGIPLVCFLAGLFLGYFLSGGQETPALLGSALGLGVGVLFLGLAERKIRNKPEWTPRVVAVYETKPDIDQIGCGEHAS